MTSEQRVLARTARGTRHVWVKKGAKRNEAWDCAVYALFAAHALDLHRYTEAMWRRLRDRIAPLQPDLLAQAALSAPRETTAPVPPPAAPAPKAAAAAPPPPPVSDGFGRGDWNERF
jgi:phage terminase large subunit GpA-like protein